MYQPNNINEEYETSERSLWEARLRDFQAQLALKQDKYLSKTGLRSLGDYIAGSEFTLEQYSTMELNCLFAVICHQPRVGFKEMRKHTRRLIPDIALSMFLHHENN